MCVRTQKTDPPYTSGFNWVAVVLGFSCLITLMTFLCFIFYWFDTRSMVFEGKTTKIITS